MINEIAKNGIFVIHALKGYENHEKRVKELFKKNNLAFEFVVDGDPSLFNAEILAKYFDPNIKTVLSEGVLSCTLNHILAYEKIIQRQIKYALIFENDPFFLGDFVKKLENCVDEIEKLPKGFIISLENSTLKFPSYWQTKRKVNLYRAKSGRMAGAYLIDLAGATNIIDDLRQTKCHTVIDWWHNSLINRGIINMYWSQPAMVEQGSHNGHLNATISTKPSSLLRRAAWLSQKYYKYYFKRLFKQKDLY